MTVGYCWWLTAWSPSPPGKTEIELRGVSLINLNPIGWRYISPTVVVWNCSAMSQGHRAGSPEPMQIYIHRAHWKLGLSLLIFSYYQGFLWGLSDTVIDPLHASSSLEMTFTPGKREREVFHHYMSAFKIKLGQPWVNTQIGNVPLHYVAKPSCSPAYSLMLTRHRDIYTPIANTEHAPWHLGGKGYLAISFKMKTERIYSFLMNTKVHSKI